MRKIDKKNSCFKRQDDGASEDAAQYNVHVVGACTLTKPNLVSLQANNRDIIDKKNSCFKTGRHAF